MKKITLFLLFFIFVLNISANFVRDFAIELEQPNGKIIKCFVTGDEYYRRIYDENNYTIVCDKNTGYYVYAILENDELLPSKIIVGDNITKKSGIVPGLDISVAKKEKIRKDIIAQRPKDKKIEFNFSKTGEITTMNILTIFVKFADSEEFPPQLWQYNDMYNSPTNYSAYKYFKEASYNELNVLASFFPISSNDSTILSYTDINPRSYYCPYTNNNPIGYSDGHESYERGLELLRRALNAIKDQVPASLDLDANGDGFIDNINFIARGTTTDWNTFLWPHKSHIWGEPIIINGAAASAYNLHVENHLLTYNTSVIVHETYHSFGLPDLYHYSYEGTPVGVWDVMSENTHPPQATAAYLRNKYTSFARPITEITTSGRYTINQTWKETNNCYKIKATGNSNQDEFFIIECRHKMHPWDCQLPLSGLIVYRINPNYDGNADGNDEIYVIRKTLEQAALAKNYNRTYLSDISNPQLAFSDGSLPNFGIFNISYFDSIMSFDVIFNKGIVVLQDSVKFNSNSILLASPEKTVNIVPFHINSEISLEIIGDDADFFEISEFDQSNGEKIVKLRFLPNEERPFNAELKITGDNEIAYVNLSGEGFLPPLVANFEASAYQVIAGREIQFNDKSTGTPSTWSWIFEGGIPETSNEENPIVTYPNIGIFPVKLSVENPYHTDDTVLNYIIVEEENEESLHCNYSFENWHNDLPNCWIGNQTMFVYSNITKIDTASYEGNYACQLKQSLTNKFFKFSSTAIPVEKDKYYKIDFYVKGQGKIYLTLYDERETNSGISPKTQTTTIDTSEYILFSQIIKAEKTTNNAEVILNISSTKATKNHLIIDNFTITETEEPMEFANNSLLDFNIFPNPSNNGIFSINCEENIEIEIYNTLGLLLKTENIKNKQILDLQSFPKGIYYLKAKNNKNEYKVKEIIIL